MARLANVMREASDVRTQMVSGVIHDLYERNEVK
jgi:hypothetical protein